MRSRLIVLGLSLALVACSSSSSSPAGGADSGGGGTDGSSSADTGGGGSDSGGLQDTGGGGNDSGGGGRDASDGGFVCSSPADCNGQVCCERIHLTGGNIPNCTNDPPVVACAAGASCATNLGTSCMGDTVQRLCKTNTDCTESSYNKCCTFGNGSGSESFCANAFVAGFGGGTCLP